KPLKVIGVDFHAVQNSKHHHTDKYEIVNDTPPTPVLRRGETFLMVINFDHPFHMINDVLKLEFNFGPVPSITKGTKNILSVDTEKHFSGHFTKWNARVHQIVDDSVTLEVLIPATCQVGLWHCKVFTALKMSPKTLVEHNVDDDIFILFNPWCKVDTVYMKNDKERQEYVLNESGKVWMGSYRQPKGRRWIFGQFDDAVLPTIMYLLELSDLPHSERGNPVLMSRAISAVVNSSDEDGLVVGRWDGDYRDGTSPHAWTGSVAIMEQYLMEGGTPVQYGQCWVFSAVTVTVCRALGIPCRSVTNYVSAHDTNCSLTIDKFFDNGGNEIPGGPDGECHDSCWNFHVWNDVWMSRPDLPQGYGGWQIIDATPQEESDSMYRCGPASVEAVKHGKVGFLYDTPFVFAEVNADVCHFQEDEKSDWGFSRLKINQYHVGRKVVTKHFEKDDDVGDSDMWDVTSLYKNPEGSHDERLSVFNAVRGIDAAQKLYEIPEAHEEDVWFDLIEIDQIKFGEPFSIVVNIENKSNEERNIYAVLSASSVYYTGVTMHKLKRQNGKFKMGPKSRETLRIKVKPEEYTDKLADHSLVKIYAIANVTETKQTWSEEDDFPLIKPDLDIKISGDLFIGSKCQAMFTFKNPLSRKLTNCSFSVEGPGLQRPKAVPFRDIEPNEVVTYCENFYPKRVGETKIMATFTSNLLTEVSGSTSVEIKE
ncbi:hypothetical protein AAG570_001825, partial [Ranatra chinensis]